MSHRPFEATSTPQFQSIRFEAFEVDVCAGELRRAGIRVKIDRRSFQILLLLLKSEGDIVSREELRQSLWPANEPLDFDRNVNKAISKLRSVLCDSVEKPRFIETIQNRGYRFIATLIFAETSELSIVSPRSGEQESENQEIDREPKLLDMSGIAVFGPFELNLQSLELRKRGALVSIHQQPIQILTLLLRRHGHTVNREEIRKYLWPAGTRAGFERSLNKTIFKLRDALGDSAERPLFVETLPGLGYRFVSPVRYLASAAELEQAGSVDAPLDGAKCIDRRGSESQEAAISNPATAAPRSRSYWVFYAAASMAIVFTLTAFLYIQFGTSGVVASSAQKNRRVSVAVLGFKNLSGDSSESWRGTALSELLSAELDAGGQLRMISPVRIGDEGAGYASNGELSSVTLSKLNKQTGADYVLVGSYGSLGNGSAAWIRVDMFLQDVTTGQIVATVSQTGQGSDLLSMIALSGSELRSRIGVRDITHEEAQQIASVLSANPDAIRFYAEGLRKLRMLDAAAAADSLQKAVALDPKDALAHDALAAALVQLGEGARARVEAQKAFNLSMNLPRPQRLLVEGRYQEMLGHWDRVIQIYGALFEFFPDNTEYGLLLLGAQLNAKRAKDALTTLEHLKSLPVPLRDDPRIDLADGLVASALGNMKLALADMQTAHNKTAIENSSFAAGEN